MPSPQPLPVNPARPAPTVAANLGAALTLLLAFLRLGVRHAVICPGSRSAPLAVAAGLLQVRGLHLHTALDERSAAFFGLGLGRALGVPAVVITTSGSAVANLLPACVEADHGALPLLVLSADRPQRLKGCGANQSVNQESFLRGSCRWFGQGPSAGLHLAPQGLLDALARQACQQALGGAGALPAGAVHLNLPVEEPLHGDGAALAALADALSEGSFSALAPVSGELEGVPPASEAVGIPRLDPDRPGVVVAGPWRGHPERWGAHLEALIRWQRRSGWPVLADPLSGLRGQPDLFCVSGYDLLLESPDPALAPPQVLRLGSLPASRRLERWLATLEAEQLLVSEGDPRPLDPLRLVKAQTAMGLQAWVEALLGDDQGPLAAAGLSPVLSPELSRAATRPAEAWRRGEQRLQNWLDQQLDHQLTATAATGCAWSEPALARQLSRLLPPGLPLMLANSSPVRDWESFADPAAAPRPMVGFRGASGIDGTLSEACGLAEALGACVLVSGDLALLHDANGWLWRPQLRGRLTVLLIDNGGGGIFEQLPIRTDREDLLDFDRLFAMPQPLDPLALAQAHGVPARQVTAPVRLPDDLAWALAQRFSLLVVRTDRRRDAVLRRRLRTMAGSESAP